MSKSTRLIRFQPISSLFLPRVQLPPSVFSPSSIQASIPPIVVPVPTRAYSSLHKDRKLEPVRDEFTKTSSSADLEKLAYGPDSHRNPENLSDAIALKTVKSLRVIADTFFQKRYIHRAVMLETVAAVPGMVAGLVRHLRSLRKMQHDGGWIHHLLLEAENERMHLLTWMKICEPKWYERLLVTAVQGIFYNAYFVAYLLFPKTAHRMVGYLEEEAIVSYTAFLSEIDNGNIKNGPAPKIAINYWNLSEDAKLRDVVLAVRADEAAHRDANHEFADRILNKVQDLRKPYETK